MDPDAAEKVYRELYKTLGRAIGFQMARNIVMMGEDGFKREDPEGSLKQLAQALITAFGKTTANIMLSTSVKMCFKNEELKNIQKELVNLKLLPGERR
ncbi:MAG: hypothetical protein AB1665_08755 [Candidatus Thermoplasmatota archaeon]